MNSWNTLLESYQQSMYNNTLATVKRQIQQAANPTPAMVVSVCAVWVDNAILLGYLTSEVGLEEQEIGSTDPIVLTDNICSDDKLHFSMPRDSGDYERKGDECDKGNAIPSASRQQRLASELQRFDLGTSYVNGYKGKDCHDADADKEVEEEASQADD
jgi:hypothetical protein